MKNQSPKYTNNSTFEIDFRSQMKYQFNFNGIAAINDFSFYVGFAIDFDELDCSFLTI